MNFKSKLKVLFQVLRNSNLKDIYEFLTLVKYLLKGWKVIVLRNDRIGHQILNTISFLSNISPEESYKYKLAISNPNWMSCNKFMTNYWDTYLRKEGYIVFSSNFTTLFIEYFESFMIKFFQKESKNNNLAYDTKKFYITETKKFYISNNKLINYAYLNKNDVGQIFNQNYQPFPKLNFKVPNSKYDHFRPFKYVCIYTRDSEYMNSLLIPQDFSYHDYRNDEYLKLIPTVEYLNSESIPVVRMGNVKKFINNKHFSKDHVDFEDLSPDGSLEIILCSNCLFYIGDTSGLATIAIAFGRPIVRYNWIPIFNSNPIKTLVIPMLIKDKETKEYLPFRKVWELKEQGLILGDGYSYEKFNLECVRNSPSEIFDVSIEMLRRVQENDFESCHPKQHQYEKMMASLGFYNPGIIGNSFMEKYGYLFIEN